MRASDRAYEALRDEIVEWQLRPGTVLGEVEQAARLGVSRTPLREALSRLAADGLVEPAPGRGMVVTGVSIDNVAEIFELRQALETHAARLVAERRDPAVFAGLLERFERVPELLERDDAARHQYYALVADLDDAIDDAVQNAYLVAALRGVRVHLVRVRRLAAAHPARLLDAAREHALIVEAIVAGDPDLAAHATHVHLHRALTDVLARITSRMTERNTVP